MTLSGMLSLYNANKKEGFIMNFGIYLNMQKASVWKRHEGEEIFLLRTGFEDMKFSDEVEGRGDNLFNFSNFPKAA